MRCLAHRGLESVVVRVASEARRGGRGMRHRLCAVRAPLRIARAPEYNVPVRLAQIDALTAVPRASRRSSLPACGGRARGRAPRGLERKLVSKALWQNFTRASLFFGRAARRGSGRAPWTTRPSSTTWVGRRWWRRIRSPPPLLASTASRTTAPRPSTNPAAQTAKSGEATRAAAAAPQPHY